MSGEPGGHDAIIYACVARGETILAEHSIRQGNFTKVVKRILETIPTTDNRMSYVFDKHYFHYEVNDGLVYLCMASEAFGRRIPFAFLEDIKSKFRGTYGQRGHDAIAFAMQSDFSRVLDKQMDYFSNNANADKIKKLQEGIDEVKNIMINNIDRVLERGEKIELLLDKTEQLQATSAGFKKASTNLANYFWWKNVKIWAVIGCVVVILGLIIMAIACGGPSLPKCVSHSPTPPPTAPPTASPTSPPLTTLAPV